MARAVLKTKTRTLWGSEFTIVDGGLGGSEVVEHITTIADELKKARKEVDRQSSLVRLAEQTVMEADRLTGEITAKATAFANGMLREVRTEPEQTASTTVSEPALERVIIPEAKPGAHAIR